MTYQEFTYWLDGFLAGQTNELTPSQVKTIKDKLDSVFNKVTPPNLYETTTVPNYDIYCGGSTIKPKLDCNSLGNFVSPQAITC